MKQLLPTFLKGSGRGLLDTAMLTNLGRVPEPAPSLDGRGPETLWFSPPCWKLTPVSVGVVTVDETMQLVFRYTTTTLDRNATEAFADRYLEHLAEPVS